MHSTVSPNLLDTFLGLRKRLMASISRLVGSQAVAEDLVQDTFLRLWERRERLPEASQLHGYVVRTSHNLAIDFRRRQKIAPFIEGVEFLDFITDETPTPEDHLVARERMQSLSQAIAALPPRARDVFIMARIDGLTYVEIGARLGISPKTVFSHMVTALEKLDGFDGHRE